MKKKVISLLLSAVMVLSCGAAVFAADAADTKTPPSGPVKLSLEQAVKQMQTEGIRAQTAELQKQSDKNTADGYSETVSSIRDMLKGLSNADLSVSQSLESGGANSANEKLMKMRRDFAKENIDKNYQADMYAIEQDTVKLYYGVLQAQDNVKAAQDNLSVQNSILANVNKKFSAGVAAKKDVLSAETSVVAAKSALKEAEVTLSSAKMNLNMLLGYPLTQEVVLTDTLKQLDAPNVTLDKAISNAVANRLDIKLADLGVQAQKILLDNLKYTTSTASSTYKKQEVAYLEAKQGYDNAPIQIEMDIRNQYAELEQKKMAIESAQATADFAKEGYRLAQISYDAGVNTLADVQETQLQAFKANQGVAAAITEYDLAVYAFKYAQDVGTKRISL